jgi:hypothetical protein
MKKSGMLSMLALVAAGCITSFGQAIESEVPGDNFSLEGALELFKKSESPEQFEKMLNSPDSKVNNLDLNGDGYIDYIRVLDRNEGNVHVFVLQAVISERENQDVAVIELEKLSNGKAVLQIIGDEDVYGVTTIIEPTREVRSYAGTTSNATVVNVWAWPSVQYVYGPYYAGWVSPWGWYRRPFWYHTWRPIAYYHYRPIWRPYYDYYAVCHTRRVVYAHEIYRPYRTSSVVVHTRHRTQLTRYRDTHRGDARHQRTREDDRRRSYAGDNSGRNRTSSESRLRSDLNENTNRSSAPVRRQQGVESNRRPVIQRERETQRTETTSRERVSPEIRRTTTEVKRDDFSNRRPVTTSNPREVRPQATTPQTNRTRSVERPNVQQRQPAPQRSVPPTVQRRAETRTSPSVSSGGLSVRQRSSAPPTVNRTSRSESAPKVSQQRSPSPSERSTPGNARRGRQ